MDRIKKFSIDDELLKERKFYYENNNDDIISIITKRKVVSDDEKMKQLAGCSIFIDEKIKNNKDYSFSPRHKELMTEALFSQYEYLKDFFKDKDFDNSFDNYLDIMNTNMKKIYISISNDKSYINDTNYTKNTYANATSSGVQIYSPLLKDDVPDKTFYRKFSHEVNHIFTNNSKNKGFLKRTLLSNFNNNYLTELETECLAIEMTKENFPQFTKEIDYEQILNKERNITYKTTTSSYGYIEIVKLGDFLNKFLEDDLKETYLHPNKNYDSINNEQEKQLLKKLNKELGDFYLSNKKYTSKQLNTIEELASDVIVLKAVTKHMSESDIKAKFDEVITINKRELEIQNKKGIEIKDLNSILYERTMTKYKSLTTQIESETQKEKERNKKFTLFKTKNEKEQMIDKKENQREEQNETNGLEK